ncbi:hypothetical protein KP79_PYT15643 [Mizuhopecten yessoensis]|uniref:Secreted protein n=1 Tax=Mizuhopecten yessoensis TaxID=6573 RepID=A0A210PMR9_MIZYE|nr:hypothetical protein KP79_PYT15643 [Mizuhopecten yessoensis]
MNGLTLAVIVTVCVGVTFATSYRRSYYTQDDDWNLYPQGSVGSGVLLPGGSVKNDFVGTVYPRYVRNGYVGVGQVGNSFDGSGLSRVLGHQDDVVYPTQHQQGTYKPTGRRYKRSTGAYSANTFDLYRRYPDVHPRYPDVYPRYPTRHPGRPVYRQRSQY